ncbi:MAG: phosphate transport system protein [Myxococcota bacterium]|jgi:phosphate transport system protein
MLQRDADRRAKRVRTRFLQMCVRAESMVRLAVRSVAERDASLGRAVVENDRELDQLEMEVDRLCLEVLAHDQPSGASLRTITAIMKMVADLERVGDLAVNIAERGLELASGPGIEAPTDLTRMGNLAADMLRMATDAFVLSDASLAREVLVRDDEVDVLNRATFRRLIAAMTAHPDQVDRALCLTNISKHLERVGDHAVNIAEMDIFVIEGEDVRHGG